MRSGGEFRGESRHVEVRATLLHPLPQGAIHLNPLFRLALCALAALWSGTTTALTPDALVAVDRQLQAVRSGNVFNVRTRQMLAAPLGHGLRGAVRPRPRRTSLAVRADQAGAVRASPQEERKQDQIASQQGQRRGNLGADHRVAWQVEQGRRHQVEVGRDR